MTDYTPTTEEVREYVSIGGEYRPWDAPDSRKEKAREAAFDRWLADHDRKIAAEALREAAEALTVRTVDPAYEGQQNDGEFGSGFYQGIRSCRRALRDRADRTEQGGES